jgi:predicted nuclease of predicted toxin-antitoxin system
MSLRFLSDQCVPAEISEALKKSGHAVTFLREVLPIRAPDPEVIARAQALNAILLSLNGDFADIVAYPPANYGGIVAIQLHNHPEIIPALMTTLTTFLATHSGREFYRGKLLIIEVHRISHQAGVTASPTNEAPHCAAVVQEFASRRGAVSRPVRRSSRRDRRSDANCRGDGHRR